ncbi:hypothetical protein IW261DRAFT_1546773 [Armillaria novae-zelandiae]|uniref:Uncharacterized protein n=1 Tax=Armillaria novae-zelandiae TaxID=153914 RepID=A0AA39KAR7_9AGAR|nr:hypothetical protein IW261DRAFT_1546773 [Armillaria novae-zelandiae]
MNGLFSPKPGANAYVCLCNSLRHRTSQIASPRYQALDPPSRGVILKRCYSVSFSITNQTGTVTQVAAQKFEVKSPSVSSSSSTESAKGTGTPPSTHRSHRTSIIIGAVTGTVVSLLLLVGCGAFLFIYTLSLSKVFILRPLETKTVKASLPCWRVR